MSVQRRRNIIVGAAAVVAALAVALVVYLNVASTFVPQYAAPADPAGPKISSNDPVAAAAEDADLTDVVDVTAKVSSMFTGDLGVTRTDVQGGAEKYPYTVDDECLLEWAKSNITTLAPTGTYEVVTVCGRPTAVLAGPASADSKVLVYAAAEDTAPAGMRELLLESTSDRVAFAAVQSADGEAQLLAASPLPDKR